MIGTKRRRCAALVAALVLAGTQARAISPTDKCEAAKNKIAGKYSFCRQKTLATAIRTGARPEYSQCDTKLLEKWVKAEQKAFDTGTPCKDGVGATEVQGYLILNSEILASALAGVGALGCPLPASGQTLCDQGDGTVGVCPGSPAGQDGALLAGTARSYTDNGNGTITDNVTGLMWEKLSDDGSVHDWDDTYTWYDAFNVKVAALNSGGGFAGRTDWRLPNVTELHSLVDYGRFGPLIDPAFSTSCAPNCTVTTCSCTVSDLYWSSTTWQDVPIYGWFVSFDTPFANASLKDGSSHYVRAVRGGS